MQKNNYMEHKKEFEELNKKSLEKYEEYLKTNAHLDPSHHENLKQAKDKWQNAWMDMMKILMYLETLEI